MQNKENEKLIGQISLLKSKLSALEKENYELKCQKNNQVLGNFTKLDSMTKQVRLLKTENKFKTNQLKLLSNSETQDPISIYPIKIEHLKELHNKNFFEYKKILNNELIISKIESIKKYSEFSDFFLIVCIKKELFDLYFLDLLNGYFISKNKNNRNIFKVLIYFPVDWIYPYLFSGVVEFIRSNLKEEKSIIFISRVINYRSSIFLIEEIFKEEIDFYKRFLINQLINKKEVQWINKTNLHLLSEDELKLIYKNDYVDFT